MVNNEIILCYKQRKRKYKISKEYSKKQKWKKKNEYKAKNQNIKNELKQNMNKKEK